MNAELMQRATKHFYRQNYYAARDLWETALDECGDDGQVEACLNALGATYDRIQGTGFSRPYFERALELERGVTLSELGLKVRTNLIHVLTRASHVDTALQVIRQTEDLPYDGNPLRMALFEVSVFNAFSRAELYDEILERLGRVEGLFRELPPSEMRNRHFASLYQYSGYAAQMLGDHEQAVHYYQQALNTLPTPDVWRDLAKVYLLIGDSESALSCLEQLYPLIWRLTTVTERIELAYTLELLAMFAWLASEQVLFRKCTEKAELYFGQESHWTEWLQMQNLEESLNDLLLNKQTIQMAWEPWNGFLDELNLLDGFNAMFPMLWPILRNAATLATRLYGEVRGVGEVEEIHLLERAARLAYVGLTALAVSEREARQTLKQRDMQQQLAILSVKLLETYPYTQKYKGIVGLCRENHLQPANREEVMAVSLGMALRYVELVEFHLVSHETALSQVQTEYQDGASEVVSAFVQMFEV